MSIPDFTAPPPFRRLVSLLAVDELFRSPGILKSPSSRRYMIHASWTILKSAFCVTRISEFELLRDSYW